MSRPRIYTYAVIWHPTEKQIKEEGAKSKLLIDPTDTLAADERQVGMTAAMSIKDEYREHLDQIEIAIRPF